MELSEIKLKADKLWEVFELEGILESLKVIEQITYLLFLRILDAKSIQGNLLVKKNISDKITFDSDMQRLRWSNLISLSANELMEILQQEVPENILNQNQTQPEIFKYFTGIQIRIQEPKNLQNAINLIDEVTIASDFELRYFYEYILTKRKAGGELGRFPTPRNIIKLLVEILDPQQDEIICDPACGTGGFLVGVLAHLSEIESNIIGVPELGITSQREKSVLEERFDRNGLQEFTKNGLFGFERDIDMMRIATMNLALLGVDMPNLYQENILGKGLQNILPYQQENFFDVIFAFPASPQSIELENVFPKLFNRYRTKNPNLLYLGLILDMLKENGRAALILPTDILSEPGRSYRAIRKQLVEENTVLGILSLDYTVNVANNKDLSVIIFQKGGHTENVFFYDLSNDMKRFESVKFFLGNEFSGCLKSWYERDQNKHTDRGAQSFFVNIADIVESNYSLSYNRFKISQYVTNKFGSPELMISQFDNLTREIQTDFSEIKRLLL